MSLLRVDTDVMAASAARIGGVVDQVDSLLAQLRGDVEALLSGWQGEAAGAHARMHGRFQADAARIRDSLAEMRQALLRTHATYVRQEGEQRADHTVAATQILD